MIVAITGATGSVGRKLVERHLAAGDRVRALSRQAQPRLPAAVEVHRGDFSSGPDTLTPFAADVDVLYHCAAEIYDPGRMIEVNANGTRNLVSAAQNRIGRWVQLGSIAVYGAPERGIIREDSALQPIDVYGRSKAEGDRHVLEAAANGAFDCCIVRPAKVFGAGIDSGNNQVLFRLFSLIDRGLFFFVGSPGALTHYVHVDNLVDALALCGREPIKGSGVFNLSDDRTLEQFVGVIAAALGKDMPTLRLPERPVRWLSRMLGRVPGFPLDEKRASALVNRAAFPSAKIEQELGYLHRVGMEAALRELVAVWRRHQ
ncbi:MAG: NAD-dependent epimerase/dehydratase family protein [Burkholderiales bacterium]